MKYYLIFLLQGKVVDIVSYDECSYDLYISTFKDYKLRLSNGEYNILPFTQFDEVQILSTL